MTIEILTAEQMAKREAGLREAAVRAARKFVESPCRPSRRAFLEAYHLCNDESRARLAFGDSVRQALVLVYEGKGA